MEKAERSDIPDIDKKKSVSVYISYSFYTLSVLICVFSVI